MFSKSRETSLRPHYLLTRGEVQELQWEAGESYVTAAASEVFCVALDLSAIPADARERFISMQALRHGPYENSAYHVVKFDDVRAMLWIWDADWERQQRELLPASLQSKPLFPETLLHPRGEDGAELRCCSKGWELQFWDDGKLISSRWFPEQPTDIELELALRAERIEVAPAIDESVVWLPSPWPEQELDWSALVRDEKTVFSAVASIMLFLLFLNFGLGLGSSLKTMWAEYRVESLGEQLGGHLVERQRAERQRDINTEWLALLEDYSQLAVVAEFDAALYGTDYHVLEWSYDDSGLRVEIYGEDINTRDVVSRLSERALFEELRVEPGRRENEKVLSMQLATLTGHGQGSDE